jgi:2-succinyl-5-enolpyruvyl-6-hydroxy-3-cyclohexene-1-carboxylate synthase
VTLASSADVAATFCATLVDEWARAGLTEAVVAPGSRSTPLALALAAEPRMRVHVVLDERSAGFVALGLALASGRPAIVLTTSGTAAVELHPAVVEAHEARVPMIACTADRPPELQDVGAPQAIDQTRLYGPVVRWFCEPGVADADAAGSWRSLAARAVVEATGPSTGPVHLNLAFREPLVGTAGPLPPGRRAGEPWHRARPGSGSAPQDAWPDGFLEASRGVIVAGGRSGGGEAITRLVAATGWPVLADPRAGCRVAGAPPVVAAFDALLRAPAFADAHRPEVVVRVGDPPASRVLAAWLVASGARQVIVHPQGAWRDPDRTAEAVFAADPDVSPVFRSGRPEKAWAASWLAAEAAAQAAIDAVLADHHEPTEPGVARATLAALPDGAALVVSSSMPVRDLEWYGRPRPGVTVLANRGANGIDGVVSTATGVALGRTGAPTAALVGDLAFLHDSSALVGLTRRGVDQALVVVDNDGGGIFSFLPQRTQLSDQRFEALLGTPQGADLAALARAHGLAVAQPTTADEIAGAVADAVIAGGVRVVHVRTDRAANVAVHDQLHAAVARAVDES